MNKNNNQVIETVQELIRLRKKDKINRCNKSTQQSEAVMSDISDNLCRSLIEIDSCSSYMNKLPYELLWKIECCAMVGYDLYYSCVYDHINLSELNGYSDFGIYGRITLDDYETLSKIYDVPVNEEQGGNKKLLIEYVCSKNDLDLHLEAFLEASGISIEV